MRDPADVISSHLDQQLEYDRIERDGQHQGFAPPMMAGQMNESPQQMSAGLNSQRKQQQKESPNAMMLNNNSSLNSNMLEQQNRSKESKQ